MLEPLTEKYRPKCLEDIRGNNEVIACLKSVSIECMPNMLFYGPPGTGKTTAIRAMLVEHPQRYVLELNASDERGIGTVRMQIKEFASMKSNFMKIIILDEADSMSRDAQNALRRIMEDYSGTRFCLICNFPKKIIEPIASRCTKFRFAPVSSTARIIEVCKAENIPCDVESAELIERYSDGDMRKVLNDIEGLRASYGFINKKHIVEFFRICDDESFDELFNALLFLSFDECLARLEECDSDCLGLLDALSARLVKSTIPNKLGICELLADTEQRIALGCSERIEKAAIVGAFILNRMK